jgi:cysteine desulfurase
MKTAVVLFSGGVDSTYTVARSANDFDKLVLITYKVPGMINVNFSSRSFLQLKKIFGDKLTHEIIDITEQVQTKRGGGVQCFRDNFKYKFLYSWCMGCKVSMHLHTIQLCKDNGIAFVIEGSNYYDANALEQRKDAKSLLADIYKTYGITIITPYYYDESVHSFHNNPLIDALRFFGLYKDATESRIKYLKSLGIDLGKGFFSQYRSTQPSCFMSLFFNGLRLSLKLIFREQGGCCTLNYGYLNYISDKFFAKDQRKRACLKSKETEKIKTLMYFDNNGTTKLDPEVIQSMRYFQEEHAGNASSSHPPGMQAKESIEGARSKISKSINAVPEEIIFTSGGTEANNFAIKGMAFAHQSKGKHVIISAIEHPSITNPALWLKNLGYEITYIPVDKEGFVNPVDVEKAIRKETILVSIMHANNEIGTIEPIEDIGKICQRNETYFHVDACQSFTKVDLDVKKQRIDLLSLSSHKIYGPAGVGALYVRKGVSISPLLHGGGQEQDLRSGTYNISGIVGFGKAVELAEDSQIKKISELRDYCISMLKERFKNILLNGPDKNRLCNNINVIFKGIRGKEIVAQLDKRGICISTGAACSSRVLIPSNVLLAIGRSPEEALQAIRIGLSKWTTREEIDFLIANLEQVARN